MILQAPENAICRKCKKEFPFTKEFFRVDNATPLGLQKECHSCCREYYKKHKISGPTVFPEAKVCIDCKKKLPISAFPIDKYRSDWARAYCKDCHRLRTESTRIQRANAEGNHTVQEWELLKRLCNYICLRCGSMDNLTKDHVVPIEKGGTNYIWNLQVLCKSCNCVKGTKEGVEWDFRSKELMLSTEGMLDLLTTWEPTSRIPTLLGHRFKKKPQNGRNQKHV